MPWGWKQRSVRHLLSKEQQCSVQTELLSCLTIICIRALFLIVSPALLPSSQLSAHTALLLFRAKCSAVISFDLRWETMSYCKWPLKCYKKAELTHQAPNKAAQPTASLCPKKDDLSQNTTCGHQSSLLQLNPWFSTSWSLFKTGQH